MIVAIRKSIVGASIGILASVIFASGCADAEAVRIADNMLLYQRDSGGRPKNINMTPVLSDQEKALFIDRDYKVYDAQAPLSRERRTGYSWMGPHANNLLDSAYPAWQTKWAPDRNVLAGP